MAAPWRRTRGARRGRGPRSPSLRGLAALGQVGRAARRRRVPAPLRRGASLRLVRDLHGPAGEAAGCKCTPEARIGRPRPPIHTQGRCRGRSKACRGLRPPPRCACSLATTRCGGTHSRWRASRASRCCSAAPSTTSTCRRDLPPSSRGLCRPPCDLLPTISARPPSSAGEDGGQHERAAMFCETLLRGAVPGASHRRVQARPHAPPTHHDDHHHIPSPTPRPLPRRLPRCHHGHCRPRLAPPGRRQRRMHAQLDALAEAAATQAGSDLAAISLRSRPTCLRPRSSLPPISLRSRSDLAPISPQVGFDPKRGFTGFVAGLRAPGQTPVLSFKYAHPRTLPLHTISP